MSPIEAKLAAIGGTRAMIREDEFALLTALLVDCGAVPANVMAASLRGLSNQLLRKARGELETSWAVCQSEVAERVMDLQLLASSLEA